MSEKTKAITERSEIPLEKTWDLSRLYADTQSWENDFKKIDALLADFQALKGKLGESPSVLKKAFESEDRLDRLLEKLYVYSHLKSDEDTGNSTNRALQDRISAKAAEIEGETAWVEPEVMAIPEKKINEYLDSPELAFYKRSLEELLRGRKHTLSEKEERILGMASDILATPHKTFSILNDADLKFPEVNDGKGGKARLTHGSYRKFLENPDRAIRREAFDAMYDTYTGFRNTFSSTLDAMVKTHAFNAELRNFPSALEASLHPDKMPVSVYENLISAARKNLGALYKYFELRTKVFGLQKLDMYDIYNPLLPECKMEVSWEEACEWVKEALKPLGAEYCGILEKAFSERWIDVLESKGKRSGAYSSGCFDSPPYVLMNFNGTLNDVFTLAHELGHSMHSYYSDHAQDYHYADYRIFVAEVASTTNELLLHNYLLKKRDDKNFRLYLLNHLADEIRGTVYRQTMFAEFEKTIHEEAENSVPLTADKLSSMYSELNSEYHGPSVKPDKKIEMEWARIPHFYYNFYVYKYATGLSAAVALSKNILSGDKKKLDAYLGFLKAGDSKDPLDIMKDAGVDLSTSGPVDTALKEFSDTVDMLQRGLLQ